MASYPVTHAQEIVGQLCVGVRWIKSEEIRILDVPDGCMELVLKLFGDESRQNIHWRKLVDTCNLTIAEKAIRTRLQDQNDMSRGNHFDHDIS